MNIRSKITSEKLELIEAQIQKNKQLPGPLMPTLHDAQHIFRYIPITVQKIIAKELNESVAKINGVVTFYSNFSVTPKGRKTIGVCLGTACYVRGSQTIMDTLEEDLGIKSLKVTLPSPSPNSSPPRETIFSSKKSPCSSTALTTP